jgi:hypothetical protein
MQEIVPQKNSTRVLNSGNYKACQCCISCFCNASEYNLLTGLSWWIGLTDDDTENTWKLYGTNEIADFTSN